VPAPEKMILAFSKSCMESHDSAPWPIFVSHKSRYIEWLISQNYKMTLPNLIRTEDTEKDTHYRFLCSMVVS